MIMHNNTLNFVSPQSIPGLPILGECKDPKAKLYRDKSRAIQLKLKGPRFELTRTELRTGITDAKSLISEEYVQGRSQAAASSQPASSQQQQIRAGSAPMHGTGTRPQVMPGAGLPRPPGGMMRPPGPGGPMMMRPRFPPGGAVFRPPLIQQQSPQPIQESAPATQTTSEQQNLQHHHQEQSPQRVSQHIDLSRQEREDIVPESIGGQQQLRQHSNASNNSNRRRESSDDTHQQLAVQSELQEEDVSNQNDHTHYERQRTDSQASEQQLRQDQIDHNSSNADLHNESQANLSQNLINQSMEGTGIQTSMMDDGEGGFAHSQKKKKIKKKKKKAAGNVDVQAHDSFIHEGGEYLPTEIETQTQQQNEEHQHQPQIPPSKQPIPFSPEKEQIVFGEDTIKGGTNDALEESSLAEPLFRSQNSPVHHEAPSNKALENINTTEEEVKIQEPRAVIEKMDHKEEDNSSPALTEAKLQNTVSSDGENDQKALQVQKPVILDQSSFSKEALLQNMRSSSHNRAQSVVSANSLSQQHQLLDQQQQPIQGSDQLKRLQDSLSYKRAQKKELTEKLVHLENDFALQQKKSNLLAEENRQLNAELRQKEREIQALKMQLDVREKQQQLTIQSLERQLREKHVEIDQAKKDYQKRKEKEERIAASQQSALSQIKERHQQVAQEGSQQLSYLQNLLRTLESRIGNSNLINAGGVSAVLGSGGSTNNHNNNNEGAGASNYQQQELMIESVQKEMREMRQNYEAKIRELNEELQTRMRNLQRVERQNVQLQEKNIKLNNLVQNMEVQQLSTVAGSGSNQRDSASMLAFGGAGGRRTAGVAGTSAEGTGVLVIEEEDSQQQQRINNRQRNQQLQQYMVSEDEGTGGVNQRHQMNQDYHGFGGGGEDIGSGLEVSGPIAAPVVGSGSGGGVGTTSASLFNDPFDEDEGYGHMGDSSNNQLRSIAGIVHRAHQQNIQSSGAAINQIHVDAVGSGGVHPDNDIDEGEEDEDEEDEEGGQDNAEDEDIDDDDMGADMDDQEEDYDQMDGGEEGLYYGEGGCIDALGNAGAVGGHEEGVVDDEGGNYDFEEGGDNGGLTEEEEGNEFDDGEDQNKRKLTKKSRGAAHGFNSGLAGFQQNIQGGNVLEGEQRPHMNYGGFSTNFQQEGRDDINIFGGDSSGVMQAQRAGAIGVPNSSVAATRQGAAVRRGAPSNEERKHGSQQQQKGQRRGNRQQNQQHTNVAGNATGSGGSSNMQNPRHPRNSRGRQQRSNQQHILQQQQQQLQSSSNPAQGATSMQQHALYGDMQSSATGSMAVSGGSVVANNAPPSSQVPNQALRTQQQQEYFQSFGDSSSHYGVNNRNASLTIEQSSSSTAVPTDLGHPTSLTHGRQTSFHQLHQQQLPVASGGGVVHTVGRLVAAQHSTSVDSMMSAESGSTALLLDRNNNNNYPPHGGGGTTSGALRSQGALPSSAAQLGSNIGGQRQQVSSVATNNQQQISSIQHHHIQQTGQNNNLQFLSGSGGMSGIPGGNGGAHSSMSELFQQEGTPSPSMMPSTSLASTSLQFGGANESASTAAVGGAAPPQSRAVAPRQRQQQQNNQQHSVSGGVNAIPPTANPFEEMKQSSGGGAESATLFYSNNNQQHQLFPVPTGGPNMRQGVMQHTMTTNQQLHMFNVIVGGSSGEQEEESSSGLHFSGGNAAIPYHHSNQQQQQFGAGSGPGGSGPSTNSFDRPGRLNLGGTNQQQQQQQRSSGGRAGGEHLDQSYHNARNDSCKTSGANTPNKDGADTPTTKAYRNQQPQNSFVHNLTSSQLFFSNQDEGVNAGNAPGDIGFGGSSTQSQQHIIGQAATLQQQFGTRAGGSHQSAVSHHQNSATSDAQIIGPGAFD